MTRHLSPERILVLLALLLSALVLLPLTGCASAPTALERRLFTVQTNYVPQIVTETREVYVTNTLPVIVDRTNVLHLPVVLTNYATAVITQQVPVYAFEPNATAAAVADTGGAVGALFGVGGIASTVLAGLFGLWARVRSAQTAKTAAALAQGLETAREVLKTTPQGQAADAQLVAWLMKHQAEAGVISQVAGIVAAQTSNRDAKAAAAALAALLKGNP